MSEVRSIEWIKRNAQQAAERLDGDGVVPANPFEKDSDAHKAWACEFYRISSKERVAQAA